MIEPIYGGLFLGRLKDGNVTGIRPMSEGEGQEISNALAVLRKYHRGAQSYEHVRRDYRDFEQYAAGLRQIIEDHGTSPDLALDAEVELNRRVMALLSSFKTFLDHTAHTLSNAFGSASPELLDFRAACTAEYDGHFAYRFAYRLRNYAQHFDLPISQLTLRGQGQKRQHIAEVSLLCVRDQLLESGFDWGSLSQDLAGQPQSWNVHVTLNDLMPCIDRIREVAVVPGLAGVVVAARKIAMFAAEASYPESQPAIIRILGPVDGRQHVRLTLTPQYHASEILKKYT